VDHHRQVRRDQLLEARRRLGHARRVVDEGEIPPIERQEQRVVPGDGQVQVGDLDLMRREEPRGRRLRRQVGVEPQHQVRVAPRAFEPQPPQQRRPVARADEAHGAAAGLLEGRATTGPGPHSNAKLS
jgi:hypothetical protein